MVVAEHTYSFRAPDTLGDRMREASQLLAEISANPNCEYAAEWIAREVARMVIREAETFRGASQSALMRQGLELFFGAAEKVADDLRYVEMYASDAKKHEREDAEFGTAVAEVAAELWRDE